MSAANRYPTDTITLNKRWPNYCLLDGFSCEKILDFLHITEISAILAYFNETNIFDMTTKIDKNMRKLHIF